MIPTPTTVLNSLRFEVHITANRYNGGQWEHLCLGMHAVRWEETEDIYSDNAHQMAHALVMLPWTLI